MTPYSNFSSCLETRFVVHVFNSGPRQGSHLSRVVTFLKSCAFVHSHGLDLHETGCLLSGRPILGLDLPGCFHPVSLILFLGPPSVLQMGSQLFSLGREGPLPSRDAPQMRHLHQHVPSVAPPASHRVPDAHVQLVEA